MKEGLAFGSIISATDPVCVLSAFDNFPTDPNMFQIIFGESVFNDAVSMVAYETVKDFKGDVFTIVDVFVIIGKFILGLFVSSILGYAIGFLSALLLKSLSKCFQETILYVEILILISVPWCSYLIGNLLGLSGILVIFFNGLAQAIYTKPNIHKGSKIVN